MPGRDIAIEFARRYEQFWSDGASDVEQVYAPGAILCAQEIVRSREHIANALQVIVGQGWREISIEIIEATSVDSVMLLACRYTAHNGEEEMTAKSSYVLVQRDGVWKAAMHTAPGSAVSP